MEDLKTIFKDMRKHLMNGVSHMIPFVVVGGILMAVSVMFYGQGGVPPEDTWMGTLWTFGSTALGLMVPVMSAYIAVSIADRPGICPGFVGGMIALSVNAGFLGGIVTGIIGGVVCFYLKKIDVPKALSSIMPIMVIPIIGSLATMGSMQFIFGGPIASLMETLTNFMNSLGEGNSILLGAVAGLFLGFDLGGPFNKVAFTFGVATISQGIYTFAGPMAVGILVPPLGCAIATIIAPKKFSDEEKDAGKSALVMSLVGITEGAIPFAANDPARVIPANMIGSAVGCAIAFAFGVTNPVAWGGFIMLPVVGNKVGFIIASLIGAGVTALIMALMKKEVTVEDTEAESDDIELSFEN